MNGLISMESYIMILMEQKADPLAEPMSGFILIFPPREKSFIITKYISFMFLLLLMRYSCKIILLYLMIFLFSI
jgi:hypothetical protein